MSAVLERVGTAPTVDDDSPYTGPHPLDTSTSIFGRDSELAELESLLLSQRIVVLYSASGVGKTSLLQAGLMPRVDEHFDVTYVRGFAVALSGHRPTTGNEYIDHVQAGLDDSASHDDAPTGEPTAERNRLIVLDQFEELFTLRQTDWPDKREFLAWLADLLGHPATWAIIALREEYIAELKPYRRLFPGGLKSEMRLEPLGHRAAISAIVGPAATRHVEFDPNLAAGLADVLSDTQARDEDGNVQVVHGEDVEPMHLQLTCQKLWRGWRADHPEDDRLTVAAADELGLLDKVVDVSQTLAEYYDAEIVAVAENTDVRERELRDWFGSTLVTESGHRVPAEWPHDDSRGQLLFELERRYLVRRSPGRQREELVELSHDLLVPAVRLANERAFARLEPLYGRARAWRENGRRRGDLPLLLLTRLQRIEKLNPSLVSSIESEFVRACEVEQRRVWRRNALIGFAVLAAVVLAVVLVNIVQSAGEDKKATQANERLAQAVLDAGRDPDAALARTIAAAAAYDPEMLRPEFRSVLHWLLAGTSTREVVRDAGAIAPSQSTVLASSPDAGLLFTVDGDEIRSWQVTGASIEPGDVRLQLATGGTVVDLVSSSDGKHVVALLAGDVALHWTADDGDYGAAEEFADTSGVALRPDGLLVRIDGAGRVFGDERIEVGTPIASVVASDDHLALLPVPDEQSASIKLAEGDGDAIDLPIGDTPTAATFSPSGFLLAVGTSSGQLVLVEPSEEEILLTVSAHSGAVADIAFLDDTASWLATTANDGELVIWQRKDEELIARRTIRHPSRTPEAIAPLAWPSQLAVLTNQRTVERWDVSVGHEREITSMVSLGTGDAATLLTGSLDGTVVRWDPMLLSGTVVETSDVPGDPASVVELVGAPGDEFVVAVWADNHLERLPCSGQSCAIDIDAMARVVDVAILADETVVALSASGVVWSWPAGADTPMEVAALDAASTHVRVSDAGGTARLVVATEHGLTMLDPTSWTTVGEPMSLSDPATAMEIVGDEVLVGAQNGRIGGVDLTEDASTVALTARQRTTAVQASSVIDMAQHSGFRATVGTNGAVQLWHVDDEAPSWQRHADVELPVDGTRAAFFEDPATGTILLVVGGSDGRIETFAIEDDALTARARRVSAWTPTANECEVAEIGWTPQCSDATSSEEEQGEQPAVGEAFGVLERYADAFGDRDWTTVRELSPDPFATWTDAEFEAEFDDLLFVEAELVDGSETAGIVDLRVLLISTYRDGSHDFECAQYTTPGSAETLDQLEVSGLDFSQRAPGENLQRDAEIASCASAPLPTPDL